MPHVVSKGSQRHKHRRSDRAQAALAPLQREVEFIRDDFFCEGRRSDLDFRSTGREQCFKELRNLRPGLTEPAVFKKYFKGSVDAICEAVRATFCRFLNIAPIRNDVDWAEKQMIDLLERERVGAENWIKAACDRFDQPPLPPSDSPLEWLSRSNWRAPAFLLSVFNPQNPYEALTAWDRLDRARTDSVLRGLRDYHWMSPLEIALAEIVGLTREELAREMSLNSLPLVDSNQILAIKFDRWNKELEHIATLAQGKRQFSEDQARKELPILDIWNAIDESRVTELRRREVFKHAAINFGDQERRFDFIGELTGRAGATAYDIYKNRPGRKSKRTRGKSVLASNDTPIHTPDHTPIKQ